MAVVALALGVGFTATFFSIIDGTLLRGLPVDEPHELVTLGELDQPVGGSESYRLDYDLFEELRREQTSFEDLAPFYVLYSHATAEGYGTDTWITAFCDSTLFDLVDVQPHLGRHLSAFDDDPSAGEASVLSYQAWQRQFGGDPDVLGKTLVVNRVVTTIVGVMPQGFGFPLRHDLWVSLRSDAPYFQQDSIAWVFAFGRLADGVQRMEAQQELEALTGHYDRSQGRDVVDGSSRLSVLPFVESLTDPTLRKALEAMGLAGLAVLLIAVANVANLLLLRSIERRREIAVRSALGARRWRLMVPLLVEALLLSVLGGGLGLLLARLGIDLFNSSLADSHLRGYWVDVRLDSATLLFVASTVLGAAILAGVLPAIKGSRWTAGETLAEAARGTSGFRLGRWTRGLLMAEVALSCCLLVATGLMLQTVHQLGRYEHGIHTDNVFTATISLWQADYQDPEMRRRFFDEVLRRLDEVPGVDSVAYTSALPLGNSAWRAFEGEGSILPKNLSGEKVRWSRVTPSFFEVFGIRTLLGEVFPVGADGEVMTGVVVSQSFAESKFGHTDVIGRGVRLHQVEEPGKAIDPYPWVPIRAVVADVSMSRFEPEDAAMVYSAARADANNVRSLAVLSSLDVSTLTRTVRETVLGLDGLGAAYRFETMTQTLDRKTWTQRVFSRLFAVFGGAALLLTVIGIYAVFSFVVERRRRELGIRRALGAQGRDLVASVVRRSMSQVAVGLLLGGLLSLAASRLLETLLFGVEPWNGRILGVTMATLAVAGFLASWWPALRAGSVDPAVVLREE